MSRESYDEAKIVDFISRLEKALSKLESHFGELRNHLEKQIVDCFSVPYGDSRCIIADRIGQFSDAVLDTDVASFALSLADTTLGRDEWLDYLGIILTDKAPVNWVDEDLRRFNFRLRELISLA